MNDEQSRKLTRRWTSVYIVQKKLKDVDLRASNHPCLTFCCLLTDDGHSYGNYKELQSKNGTMRIYLVNQQYLQLCNIEALRTDVNLMEKEKGNFPLYENEKLFNSIMNYTKEKKTQIIVIILHYAYMTYYAV